MNILFVYSVQKSVIQEKPLLGQEGIYFGISLIVSVLKAQRAIGRDFFSIFQKSK